jgi:hypothetical protein
MGEAHQASSDSDLLRAYLADRDVPCPVCGYNLRGLNSTDCPECGATLDWRALSSGLKRGTWVAALIGVGVPLGLMLTVSVAGIMANLSVPPWGQAWGPVVIHGGGAVLYALALFTIIWKRRRFWCIGRANQVRLAALICAFAWLTAAVLCVAVWLITGSR